MTENPPTFTRKDFTSDQEVRWCPGCGDYAILAAMQRTLPQLGATPDQTVFISGIGCSSRFPYYMNTYGFHTIHGRAPAFATGLKLSNPDLDVWVVTGDGDGLSIGGNHLLHALRRNVNLQILLFNNRIYGLTKGQYSPTSKLGQVSPSTPLGALDRPVNPVRFALGAGARFVARGYDVSKKLPEVLTQAHAFGGAALVEILQNCPVFNDGAFESVTDRKVGGAHQLWVEHGKPLIFGAEGAKKGLRLNRSMGLEVVELGDGDDTGDLLVHDETNPNLAWLLAGLEDIPGLEQTMAFGVLFRSDAPAYDDEVHAQVDNAVKRASAKKSSEKASANGAKSNDLNAMLRQGHTWTV